MHKKDLGAIRAIFDLQKDNERAFIQLSKASFKDLLEYAEKCKEQEVLERLKYKKGRG